MKRSTKLIALLLNVGLFTVGVLTVGCSQVDNSRAMLSRSALTGDELAAQEAVEQLVASQCVGECQFARENFGMGLQFAELDPQVKTLRYDRVFRRSSEGERETMNRGESAGYVITGIFLEGEKEVLIDFTVREDVSGMTVDEIELVKK